MIAFHSVDARVWRAVERQSKNSTRVLVDSDAEQWRLEALIEISKPSIPDAAQDFDVLLYTPLRYPRADGSRFRAPMSLYGVLYTALRAKTCMIEVIFHRLMVFRDSPSMYWPAKPQQFTVFGIDLLIHKVVNAPPVEDETEWANLSSYPRCQDFAAIVRAAGGEAIAYPSARHPRGQNIAV